MNIYLEPYITIVICIAKCLRTNNTLLLTCLGAADRLLIQRISVSILPYTISGASARTVPTERGLETSKRARSIELHLPILPSCRSPRVMASATESEMRRACTSPPPQGRREDLARQAALVAPFSLEELAAASHRVASREERLAVEPLVYLPDIGTIACAECRYTLPASQRGLARHLRNSHSNGVPLTQEESKAQAARLSAILDDHGSLTLPAAARIPHQRYYFASLRLYTDSLTCVQEGCSWVYAGVTDLFKVGKRHMNDAHGKYCTSTMSHEAYFVRGLPVQRVERLQAGREVRYFRTALPVDLDGVDVD